jgi:hypothetical protein
MKKELRYTYRGFDTEIDARTFGKFLTFQNYTGINYGFDEESNLWRVYFYC